MATNIFISKILLTFEDHMTIIAYLVSTCENIYWSNTTIKIKILFKSVCTVLL